MRLRRKHKTINGKSAHKKEISRETIKRYYYESVRVLVLVLIVLSGSLGYYLGTGDILYVRIVSFTISTIVISIILSWYWLLDFFDIERMWGYDTFRPDQPADEGPATLMRRMLDSNGLQVALGISTAMLYKLAITGELPGENMRFELIDFLSITFYVYSVTAVPLRWKLRDYNKHATESIEGSANKAGKSLMIVKNIILKNNPSMGNELQKHVNVSIEMNGEITEKIGKLRRMFISKTQMGSILKFIALIAASFF